MNNLPIHTFVINLKQRKDRKKNILKEFAGKDEFIVHITEPIKHEVGAISLWNTLKHIVKNISNTNEELIIICEDDHQFTLNYSKDLFLNCLKEANDRNADILLGGVSWLTTSLQVSPDLYWLENFTGLQFTVIFKKFFKVILDASFVPGDCADIRISALSNNKLLIYPFISIQKEFGYSDVTSKNNIQGRVDELFKKSSECIALLKKVTSFYMLEDNIVQQVPDSYENIHIPTYIISSSEANELEQVKKQFAGRNEFDITIIETDNSESGDVVTWKNIVKIIELAIANDDDVIIICHDTHEFGIDYSKAFFLRNVIEAYSQGTGILLGGMGDFGHVTPISQNRFWINSFCDTEFVVVYKELFQRILDTSFAGTDTINSIFSEITSNKMVIFPFISIPKSGAHPNISEAGKKINYINDVQVTPYERLENIKNVILKYKNNPQFHKIV